MYREFLFKQQFCSTSSRQSSDDLVGLNMNTENHVYPLNHALLVMAGLNIMENDTGLERP